MIPRPSLVAAGAGQMMEGHVERIVRQLKRTPMHTDAAFGAEIEVDLHRLVKIDMLFLHETSAAGTRRRR